MRLVPRRALPLVAAGALLVATVACTYESPASTPPASTPATLFTHPSVERAWQVASARKRPLVVMFTTDRCPHCDRMLAETYGHSAVRRLLAERAETVLAHARDNRELVQKLGIRGYPTSLVVAADGQIVDAVEGYLDAPAFARRIAPWIDPAAQAAATPSPSGRGPG